MQKINSKFCKDVEIAERYSVNRSTIWRWVKQGLLPQPIKIAGTTRFDLEACDEAFNVGGCK